MSELDLALTCPHCEKPVNIDDKFLGHEVACPSCSGMVEISHDPHTKQSEKTLYADSKIKITNKRVEVGGSTFYLKFVASVGRMRENPKRIVARWLFYAGLLALATGIVVLLFYKMDEGFDLISIGVLMVATAMFLALRPTFTVVVTIDREDVKLLSAKDRAYVINIVYKLKKALTMFQKDSPYLHLSH